MIDRAAAFWSRVDTTPGLGPTGSCWEWSGYRTDQGYGRITRTLFGKREQLTHRIAWIYTYGATTQQVLHRCDNPPCCNPDHLWIGTNTDNVADRVRKGRTVAVRGLRHGRYTHPERTARRERNRSFKFPDEVGHAVRAALSTGASTADVARRFGMSQPTVSLIKLGQKRWAALDQEHS